MARMFGSAGLTRYGPISNEGTQKPNITKAMLGRIFGYFKPY